MPSVTPAIPREFEDLLTPAGLRLLAGRGPHALALADPRRRFVGLDGLINRSRAARVLRVLEDRMLPHLAPLEMPIPGDSIWGMREDYAEILPKTTRVRTAMLENRRARSSMIAEEIGIAALLKSESLAAFAEALVGRRLDRRNGQQVLCYGAGDYAGPHNDHHPENARAAAGYLDLHLSLCTKAVEHQYLVYARGGHFTEILPVASSGFLTVYRLPFWHYTTPLKARVGMEDKARRWVLLATWLYRDKAKPIQPDVTAR